MNQFLKVCIILDALLILALLFGLIKTGILSRKYQTEYDFVAHRNYRMRVYASFLVLLALVVCLRRDDLSEQGRITTLLIVHWIADAILLTMTALIEWWYNGRSRPDIHSRFVYLGFVPTLVIVVITGIVLTVRA